MWFFLNSWMHLTNCQRFELLHRIWFKISGKVRIKTVYFLKLIIFLPFPIENLWNSCEIFPILLIKILKFLTFSNWNYFWKFSYFDWIFYSKMIESDFFNSKLIDWVYAISNVFEINLKFEMDFDLVFYSKLISNTFLNQSWLKAKFINSKFIWIVILQFETYFQ